jgi:hypothetical protein
VRVVFYAASLVLTPVAGVAALFAVHPASTVPAVAIVAGLPALLTAAAARLTRRRRRDAVVATAFAAAVGLAAGIGAVLFVVSQIAD